VLPELAIRRPVLAAVASLLIVVFGIASVFGLPIRELPDADRAVVTVTTEYTGASPQVVDTDVAEIIEGSVSGIAGIRTLSSTSRRGRSRTRIEFETSRDIDEAANDVRDAVGRVRARLPDDIDEPRVVKSDSDGDPVIWMAITSSRHTNAEITDYLERVINDRLATLEGVAGLNIYGKRRLAIRIWLDRKAMAARRVTVRDVELALQQNNVELPAGDLKSVTRQLSVRLDTRLTSVAEFDNIVVRDANGYKVRLGEVARTEAGVEDENTIVRVDGKDAVGIGVLRQSQANTMAISHAVRAEVKRLAPTLPEGMTINVGSDDATYIAASLREVVVALAISLCLVVIVILVGLRSWRATIIPAVTIPVSLIGCFAFISLLGFSINVLTLLALLLAIGLVVDDAIVMLENIQRRIDMGEAPLVAGVRGGRQVTFAILATSVTLIAVFVPISFLEGQVGRLFVEFGFVMAAAVAISTFVALTLCPAIASRILRPGRNDVTASDPTQDSAPSNWLPRTYGAILSRALDAPLIVIAICATIAAASGFIYQSLPRELAPKEDRGLIFIPLTAPLGSTKAYTDAQAQQVEGMVDPLRKRGEFRTAYTYTGWANRPHRSFIVVRLTRWKERDRSSKDIASGMIRDITSLPGVRGFPVTPAGLGLRGNSSPLRIVISGADFTSVQKWATTLLEAAQANDGLRNAELDYEENEPQLTLSIDRERANDLGVSAELIAGTLRTMLASREVTRYVHRGREYSVILQAAPEDRTSPDAIDSIFVRSGDGETLVPLQALITKTEGAASASLRRFARLPSIRLTAALADGYPLGQAIADMEATAQQVLPPQARLSLDGQSREFRSSSGGVLIVVGLALLIVFLVLAAQFESFIHPAIILLTVPLAIAGALYALWLGGLSINVFSQIGILLLIGLMAKNGILIVEFANQLRETGLSPRDAVQQASVIRLRAIVMTVISTVFGAIPLVLASGAGAESRIAIGTVIMGGLLLSAILTVFLTPVLYALLAPLTKPRRNTEDALVEALETTGKSANI